MRRTLILKWIPSLEVDSLQRTLSLFTQGLEIDQIAEIQGLSMGTVFRQFEKLILTGKIKDIEGLLPPQREHQIKDALEKLENELDSLIRTKMGDGCQEDELELVKLFSFPEWVFPSPEILKQDSMNHLF